MSIRAAVLWVVASAVASGCTTTMDPKEIKREIKAPPSPAWEHARDAVAGRPVGVSDRLEIRFSNSPAADATISRQVARDGTIQLDTPGSIHVAGKTLDEAAEAVREAIAVSSGIDHAVEIHRNDYYLVTVGLKGEEEVAHLPLSRGDTVLDALSQVGGLSQLSTKRIHIVRPAPGMAGCEQILPVDWVAISRGGVTATNYQLFPGDSVLIAEELLIAKPPWWAGCPAIAAFVRLCGPSCGCGRMYERLRPYSRESQ
jgi:protein involved in polysaccharide export with SLBB domain